MKTKRHRSLSCLCFEPEIIDSNYNLEKKGSVDHDDLKKKKKVYPTKPPKIVSDIVFSEKSLGGCKNDNSAPPPPIFNRIFKVVMFQSYLKKKLRNRKVLQDPIRSDSSRSYSSLLEKIPDTRSRELKADSTISNSTRSSLSISSRSSNFSFSSSNPSHSGHSRSKSSYEKKSGELNLKELKHRKMNSNLVDVPNQGSNKSSPGGRGKLIRNSTNALCLLLVSLLVLIFWGKICAILCTSTFVYFAPSRKEKEEEEEEEEEEEMKSKELWEIESKEYRKRVIMEGFLERNHNRVESETNK